MGTLIAVIAVVAFGVVLMAFSTIRIAREYERGVVFRLGRLIDLRGPGLFLILGRGRQLLTTAAIRGDSVLPTPSIR